MSDGIYINAEVQDDTLEVRIEFLNPELIGHDATLRIGFDVRTTQSGGTREHIWKLTEHFRADQAEVHFRIPVSDIKGFEFRGQHIVALAKLQVVIDDGVIFDTKTSVNFALPLPPRREDGLAVEGAVSAMAPKDQFSFSRSFQSVPLKSQLVFLAFVLATLILPLGHFIVSLLDQFEMAGGILYPPNMDFPPVIFGIFGLVAGGIIFAVGHKKLLSGYVELSLKSPPEFAHPGQAVAVKDLFSGVARVPLTGVRVRVVAGSLECGQYVTGTGTDRKTVRFRRPVRAVVLYDKTTAAIPQGIDLEAYFNDEISFDSMFECLYPPLEYSRIHRLENEVLVQFIIPGLPDQQLALSPTLFPRSRFFEASS